MDEKYLKQYLKEMKEYTSNDSLNDIKCFKKSKTLNDTLNERFIAKSQYLTMIRTLESWNVFKPKTLTFKYGVERCYNVFEYVLNTPNVKNKGAYFRKCLAT